MQKMSLASRLSAYSVTSKPGGTRRPSEGSVARATVGTARRERRRQERSRIAGSWGHRWTVLSTEYWKNRRRRQGADRTQRKPTLDEALSTSPLPRVPG